MREATTARALLFLVVGTFVAVFVAAGALYVIVFSPNTQTFVKGDVSLLGRVSLGVFRGYDIVRIGEDVSPYAARQPIWIRVDRGNTTIEIALHDIDIKRLEEIAPSVRMYPGEPQEHQRHTFDCVTIRISRDRVQSVLIRSSRCQQADVWIKTKVPMDWINIPFDNSDAERLFGEPDDTRRFFMH